jgi:hypothetical protein
MGNKSKFNAKSKSKSACTSGLKVVLFSTEWFIRANTLGFGVAFYGKGS